MTDIVERLRDQCRLGHDDHGHRLGCSGRAAAEIDRVYGEMSTTPQRAHHPRPSFPDTSANPAFGPTPTDPEPSSAVERAG